ncbi:hypothetical protein AIOL_000044 [Candidatus Rhodobacter oscarellae]|uniref:PepSY domain-containing protein n=1 Tax=Candidatus Rhodobacter oscarellae TaxID=1675527 RepID=A0A0J9EAT2_9RHOB|nr:hypothetical protein [Candidatus Rhodobacter lobularis]KMW59895.1 hypothetical protein AIOL_000044 [Candidatus Rhodobacter lobularis]
MRAMLLALALALSAIPAAPAKADVVSAWSQQLRIDGYEKVVVTRTWLGRVRIIAEKTGVTREIIINPRTGEVLRDYSRDEKGRLRLPLGFDPEMENELDDDGDARGGGDGGSGDDDDGDDDSDDSDGDGDGDGDGGGGDGGDD